MPQSLLEADVGFQLPITIQTALQRISTHQYVLPAIQREFVWRPQQICRLFDSLMRGYPIGSFLFWKVDRENTRQFSFYDFVLNYHQWLHPHCPRLALTGDHPVVAVLDGQQRLTALNIGLRGSLAVKLPRKRYTNLHAYPVRTLHLNLLGQASENEDGVRYDFRFLRAGQEGAQGEEFWFPVQKILDFSEPGDIYEYAFDQDALKGSKQPARTLALLHKRICQDPIINFFQEEEQDLDKVLNIFIRVNSGGTVLSYSDLLLSIATAQWSKLDARKAIHDLVDKLCAVRQGFTISKDLVLKAGLILTDRPNVTFKVTNFNAENMALLEDSWDRIDAALALAVQLAAECGLSERTLKATSALLPIAYYFYRRGFDESFLTHKSHRADREAMKGWLLRSLLKTNFWGGGTDTLLSTIRAAIKAHGAERFPLEEIETAMSLRSRSLRFDEEEIQHLADLRYVDRRTLPLLSLLFPFVDVRDNFHLDHIFPRSRFTTARLKKAGINDVSRERFQARFDRLPNLQLLFGAENQSKRAALPSDWLTSQFPDPQARAAFRDRHLLGDVPDEIADFETFHTARRQRLVERLRVLLGVEKPEALSPAEVHAEQAAQAVSEAVIWPAEVVELLEEAWHPLAQRLMARGMPAPDSIERELLHDGLALDLRSIMGWGVRNLVDAGVPVGVVDGPILRVQPDSPVDEILTWIQDV